MSVIVLPKSETLPSDLRGKKAETETLISHFSQSIPILGNERKVTDGVLIRVGNQVLNLAKDACNRLSYSFYLFIFSYCIGTSWEVISCFVLMCLRIFA